MLSGGGLSHRVVDAGAEVVAAAVGVIVVVAVGAVEGRLDTAVEGRSGGMMTLLERIELTTLIGIVVTTPLLTESTLWDDTALVVAVDMPVDMPPEGVVDVVPLDVDGTDTIEAAFDVVNVVEDCLLAVVTVFWLMLLRVEDLIVDNVEEDIFAVVVVVHFELVVVGACGADVAIDLAVVFAVVSTVEDAVVFAVESCAVVFMVEEGTLMVVCRANISPRASKPLQILIPTVSGS